MRVFSGSIVLFFFFFFFKQKTAYEIRLSLVGSEMCIRDSLKGVRVRDPRRHTPHIATCVVHCLVRNPRDRSPRVCTGWRVFHVHLIHRGDIVRSPGDGVVCLFHQGVARRGSSELYDRSFVIDGHCLRGEIAHVAGAVHRLNGRGVRPVSQVTTPVGRIAGGVVAGENREVIRHPVPRISRQIGGQGIKEVHADHSAGGFARSGGVVRSQGREDRATVRGAVDSVCHRGIYGRRGCLQVHRDLRGAHGGHITGLIRNPHPEVVGVVAQADVVPIRLVGGGVIGGDHIVAGRPRTPILEGDIRYSGTTRIFRFRLENGSPVHHGRAVGRDGDIARGAVSSNRYVTASDGALTK